MSELSQALLRVEDIYEQLLLRVGTHIELALVAPTISAARPASAPATTAATSFKALDWLSGQCDSVCAAQRPARAVATADARGSAEQCRPSEC